MGRRRYYKRGYNTLEDDYLYNNTDDEENIEPDNSYKVFLVLRGAPGCGKSEFIEKNNIQDFTIASSSVRQDMINKGRDRGITQERFHREVWKEVVWNIDFRMRYNDPLIVLDSQAMYSKDMEHYRFMVSKYGYDAYVVDCYSDVGLDTCLKRNAEKAFPRPEWLITRFFETVEHEKIPDFYLDEVSRQDAKMIIKEALKHCDPDS